MVFSSNALFFVYYWYSKIYRTAIRNVFRSAVRPFRVAFKRLGEFWEFRNNSVYRTFKSVGNKNDYFCSAPMAKTSRQLSTICSIFMHLQRVVATFNFRANNLNPSDNIPRTSTFPRQRNRRAKSARTLRCRRRAGRARRFWRETVAHRGGERP